jgi:uncharacterized membrane protein
MSTAGILRWWGTAGRPARGVAMGFLPDPLHPAIVHFPIALSLVALLFEVLARHPRARVLESSAGLLMVLAALGSVAAVLSGQAARDDAVVPAGVGPLLGRHEDIGETAMWVLLAAAAVRLVLAWRGWFKGVVPWAYLALALAAAGLVSYNGYLGGRMVFDHGLGTGPVQRGAPAKAELHLPAGAPGLTSPAG